MRFEFDPVDRFIAGTVGQPGERAFFIQARTGTRLVSVGVEKLQLNALAERLEIVIKELRKIDLVARGGSIILDGAPLEVPIESEFDVGAMSISWDESEALMDIELYEISIEQSEPENSLLVRLRFSQCLEFIKRSRALIGAGRLPCPFCAIPIDPQGHLCPRANGYRR